MTERTPGIPSPGQVVELLRAEFERAGYEIEDVAVDSRARPPRLRIVADGDIPLDLDTVAELSRRSSALLDDIGGVDAYLLEVTSPGVDRPLTVERHFRRARGRKVELGLADGTTLTGRLGEVSDGVVQVEFSPPGAREIELAGTAETTDKGVNLT